VDSGKWFPLPKQYELADTSGITTIHGGDNTFDIELKWRPLSRIKKARSDVPRRNYASVAEGTIMAPCGSRQMRLRARQSFAWNYPRIAATFQ
jgi:hypothetical protein